MIFTHDIYLRTLLNLLPL